ncbi:MAG: T9SS type A sorting domain-containing protein [Ferruginibacter sp.]
MKHFFLFLLLASNFNLKAQWSADPQIADTKVFTSAGNQNYSYSVADGSGGAIIFWESYNGTNNEILYNHLNSSGVVDWASVATGKTLISGVDYRTIDQVISDGSGGAFIAWDDEASGYQAIVQHISSTGAQLWTAGGIALSSNGYSAFMCKDGSGGIIAAWSDDQYDPVNGFPRSYAQRISSTGTPMWAAGGIRVINTSSFDGCLGVVSDGSGGAIITMVDTRNDVFNTVTQESSNLDIYAQRLSSLGVNQWASAGVPVCTNTNNQIAQYAYGSHNYIVSDGVGGAIIAWEDFRNDANNGNSGPYNGNIYSQRLNTSGVAQWSANGVVVCNQASDQYEVYMMPDGASGAVVTWQDERSGYGIYTQKLNSGGAAQWTANGKVVASNTFSMDYSATADESGTNFLVTWAQSANSPEDITVQKIAISDGSFLWGTGTLACGRGDDQTQPSITNNGAGGAIISWTDDRNSNQDIYANRILVNGSLPVNFIDFNATLQSRDVRLDWATATESNSLYFGVQKSNDGIHFNETAKVNAAGNSSIEKHYQYIDANVFANNPVLYYRISETDRDGKAFYSKIRQVKNNFALLQKTKLISNPVKANAEIEYISTSNSTVAIKIVDQQGRIVLSSSVNIFKGTNKISLSTQALAGGIYTIILSGNETNSKLKMVKE